MTRWYLLHYSSRLHNCMCKSLTAIQIEFYCPYLISLRSRSDCNSVRVSRVPLFPGYIFVNIDFEITPARILTDIKCVKNFVRSGKTIVHVPDEVIFCIKNAHIRLIDTIHSPKSTIMRRKGIFNIKAAVYNISTEHGTLKKQITIKQEINKILLTDPVNRVIKLLSLIEIISKTIAK